MANDKRRALPTARILKAVREKKWEIIFALAEFVDNCFGEKRGRASRVWIGWDPKLRVFTILDDGQGMRDVSDLFTLGQGAESGAGDIGIFGVGATEAALFLANQMDVWTLRKGRVAHMKTDWERCVERSEFPVITNKWKEATAATCPTVLLEVEHGTLIRLELRRGVGRSVHPEYLQERLSRLFGVGLRSGRRLTWTSIEKDGDIVTQIREWSPGKLEDVIHETIMLTNGFSATLHAGRVDGLSLVNSKIAMNYLYRQVKETSRPFGRPVQGACGYLDLSEQWLECLTTTKEDIRADARELEDELMIKAEVLLRPLVEQLQKAKRAKIFQNVKFSLKHRFQTGFTQIVMSSGGRGPGGGSPPKPPGPDPKPPRKQQAPAAAEIEIEEASGADIDGLLCKVDLDAKYAVAYVNKDHDLVVTALDAEPVNQRLLEQILVVALTKEILSSPDGLVRFGLFSKDEAERLYEKYDGNVLEIFMEVIRLLTDSIVVEKPGDTASAA